MNVIARAMFDFRMPHRVLDEDKHLREALITQSEGLAILSGILRDPLVSVTSNAVQPTGFKLVFATVFVWQSTVSFAVLQ